MAATQAGRCTVSQTQWQYARHTGLPELVAAFLEDDGSLSLHHEGTLTQQSSALGP